MKKNKSEKKEYHGVKEIARRANVSIATVDRVLHNRPGVASYTKKKIEQIIKEINYQPNVLASRLASRKIYKLAALIPKVSEDTNFWQAPLDGIKKAEEVVKEYGVHVELYFFDLNDRRSFEDQGNLVLENHPDGILLAPSFINEAKDFTAFCEQKQIPYVLIDSNIPDREGLSYIGPNLFRSGYLGAQLINFIIKQQSKILVVNIAKEMDDHHYLLQIEEGFRAYFKYKNMSDQEISRIDITLTDHSSVEKAISEMFALHPDIKGIFVTNSRVFPVAKFLEKNKLKDIFLIGYDYLSENIDYLNKEIINILICHKPYEQGYKAVMALYQHFVLGTPVEKVNYMPIDIITKENYEFYHN